MGSDLFGSFAESTCAALVVSGASLVDASVAGDVVSIDYLWYPLLVTAFGIIVCVFTTIVALSWTEVREAEQIEATLKH